MIPDYLESLARELDFDRSLSRCVRQEVEDHLWEAVAADPSGDTLKAQRRAIANFGVAGDLIAMKARVAWYAAAQWGISDDMRALRGLVILIDRYAFWTSVIIGLGALAYIHTREIPAAFYPAYRQQLRCFFLLCSATAAALVVSVISDGVLTALQVQGMAPSVEIWVAILTMAIEIACAGFLVFHIRSNTQRAASTAALLKA
jgi:hypothetical protein